MNTSQQGLTAAQENGNSTTTEEGVADVGPKNGRSRINPSGLAVYVHPAWISVVTGRSANVNSAGGQAPSKATL